MYIIMTRLVAKKEHQNTTCYNEVGRCAQNKIKWNPTILLYLQTGCWEERKGDLSGGSKSTHHDMSHLGKNMCNVESRIHMEVTKRKEYCHMIGCVVYLH